MNNELYFTVLGPSGCGKTTLLACMNEYFSRVMPGAFEAENPATFNRLSEAYEKLRHEAEDDGHEIIFSGGVEGTDTEHQYPFILKGGRRDVRMKFFDFPGGWLNPRDPGQSAHFSDVSAKIARSSVIIAVINSPYLMQYNGKYRDYAGIDEAEYIIESSLTPDSDKLILLVPVKCEKYLASPHDANELKETVKSSFAKTISLAGNSSPYHGKIAIALLPVKTMGNVQLSRFDVRDGNPAQVFRRITDSPFMPEYTDQPLRYAISFLLEEYKKSRAHSVYDLIFGSGNLDGILDDIRQGIRTNTPGAEIIAGRELIGVPSGEGE